MRRILILFLNKLNVNSVRCLLNLIANICNIVQKFSDNVDNLLKSDDDCEGDYEELKECCSNHQKEFWDPSISNVSSMSTINITCDGDYSSPFSCQFKD